MQLRENLAAKGPASEPSSPKLAKVSSSATFGSATQQMIPTITSGSDDSSSTEVSDSESTEVTDDSESNEDSDISLRNTFLLPFSASTVTGLEARVSALHDLHSKSMDIVDLAYTLGCRRTHFTERGFVIARRGTLRDDLKIDRLRTISNVKPNGSSPSDFAFVFTGQGAQWPGMGKELFEEFSVFRQCIRAMDTVLKMIPHPPEWTIEGILFEPAETSGIHTASCAQPMATALQVATVELLTSWNVHPKRVVGHSSGEVAAAFAAGHISSTEAITAAYYRGYLNGVNKMEGSMMAVGLACEEAEAEICQAALCGKIGIACVNSPVSVTMSGDADAVTALSKDLQGRGIFARELNTGGKAYHSHHMAVLGPELERLLPLALKQLPSSECIENDVEFISSVTGQPKTAGFDAAYWRTNMESTVLFSQAVQCLIMKGDVHLIEIGPHSALELPLKQIRKEMNISEHRTPYSSSLTRGQDAAECSLNLLGRLFLHGQPVDFYTINNQDVTISPRVLPDLPPYPRIYEGILWREPRVSREIRYRTARHHELLGSRVPGGDGLTRSWRNMLQTENVPWLESHKLEDTIIFPGAGYIAMAMEAISQAIGASRSNTSTFALRNVGILAALVLAPETETEIFTTLRPKPLSSTTKSKEWWDFEIVSYTDGYSSVHATGSISLKTYQEPARSMFPSGNDNFNKAISGPWYDKIAKVGLNFGPDFQSIKEVGVQMGSNKPQRYARTVVQSFASAAYSIHPITIDALLQSGIMANAGSIRKLQAKVPVSIESADFYSPGGTSKDFCSIHAMAQTVGFGTIEIGAELRNGGQIYAHMTKVRMAPYTPATRQNPRTRQPMNRVVWKPDLYADCWNSDTFSRYLEDIEQQSTSNTGVIIAHLVSLITHKNPKLRILELSDENAEFGTAFSTEVTPLIGSYNGGYLSSTSELFGVEFKADSLPAKLSGSATRLKNEIYDVILLPSSVPSDLYLHAMLPELKGLIKAHGLVLATTPRSQTYGFEQSGFRTIHKDSSNNRITLARVTGNDSDTRNAAIIVECDDAGASAQLLAQNMRDILGSTAKTLKFMEVSKDTIPPGSAVYSILEVEHPLLLTMTEAEMTRLKVLTDRAAKIAWCTGGAFMKDNNPDFALASGLARAVMIEQPSLAFCTFDVDKDSIEIPRTAQNLCSILQQPANAPSDFEFIQHEGLIQVSRFVPDDSNNRVFRQKYGNETVAMSLAEARPSRLTMSSAGQLDTISFKKEANNYASELQSGFVEVEVEAFGLNAKVTLLLSLGNHPLDTDIS